MAEFIAFLKAFPTLVALLDKFVSAWAAIRLAHMKAEHREGIRKAVKDQDQRDLEHAIGSPNAGKPSDLPGSVIVDDLPGVRKPSKN